MFESTLAQFDAIPQKDKSSMHRRRAGLKRIDDEHLINLEKRSVAEEKRLQEEAQRKERTKYIVEAFKRLTEDGRLKKEELKAELE